MRASACNFTLISPKTPSPSCIPPLRTHVYFSVALERGNTHLNARGPFLILSFVLQAHQHATNADEYTAKGLLIPAADEHQKSADAFQSCIEASNDENVRKTLPFLHSRDSLLTYRRGERCECSTMNTARRQRSYKGGSLLSARKASIPHCRKSPRHLVHHLPLRRLRKGLLPRRYHIQEEECRILKSTSLSCSWDNRSVAHASPSQSHAA